jgi:hypothetical protein
MAVKKFYDTDSKEELNHYLRNFIILKRLIEIGIFEDD